MSHGASHEGLRLRQRSWWNGFDHEFLQPSGQVVGGLHFPTYSQPKNARLALHPPGSSQGDVQVRLHGEALLLKFEHLRRGFTNDLRYTLETSSGEVLCSADVVYEAKRRLPALRLTHPVVAEVLPSESLWKKRFAIVDASGRVMGDVREPRALTLRFEYAMRWPEAAPPLQAFLLAVTFLVRR